MADIGTMREAIKTRLEAAAVPNLRVYERWPNVLDSPRGGCAGVVVPRDGEYEQSFGTYPFDRMTLSWELHCFVDTAGGLPNAEEILDRYLSNEGVHSIRLGMSGDRRLGGEVDYVFVQGFHDYGIKLVGDPPDQHAYVGAVLDLHCDLR